MTKIKFRSSIMIIDHRTEFSSFATITHNENLSIEDVIDCYIVTLKMFLKTAWQTRVCQFPSYFSHNFPNEASSDPRFYDIFLSLSPVKYTDNVSSLKPGTPCRANLRTYKRERTNLRKRNLYIPGSIRTIS